MVGLEPAGKWGYSFLFFLEKKTEILMRCSSLGGCGSFDRDRRAQIV